MTTPDAFATERATSLWSPSFLGLLFTQFLTAVNDNIFRWLIIGIGKDHVDPSNVSVILTAGTACFVLPYLILATPAGYMADRFNKQRVIVGCKIAEIRPDQRYFFQTVAQAEKLGYDYCAYCFGKARSKR